MNCVRKFPYRGMKAAGLLGGAWSCWIIDFAPPNNIIVPAATRIRHMNLTGLWGFVFWSLVVMASLALPTTLILHWVHKFSKHMPLQQQCSLYVVVFVYNFMQVLFVVLAFGIIFLAGNGMDNRRTVVELVSWWSRLSGHVKSLVELPHMNHSSVFSWLCYCSKACSVDGVGSKCSRMYACCITQ